MSTRKNQNFFKTCSPKLPLSKRDLITAGQAGELMNLFKILANDTRLRLIHVLVRENERCVSELAEDLGMGIQAISNQLQKLIDRNIVTSRREGNQIFYRISDPCFMILLDRGLCLLEEAKMKSKSD